ncbi:DegT/DnrJ/EryC1/StrS family aminotransferase [Acidobacteriia bacterium AH_259_A11_L15]|nr:DegT/DnrJ/EryC1/StrS family aminotransferase [Acidobacteriia bacterium AH_259_A11_L15]
MEATTMRTTIPQFEPYLGQEEIFQVNEVLRSGWITEGARSQEFVKRLVALTGARYVSLAPNGTLALYAALKLLGIREEDEVIVPDFTFLASATAVVLTGATPVFVDVDSATFNILPELIEPAITKRTKAIMPVHIYGQAAKMDAILDIAKRHNLKIVEDAAQGIGVSYKGRHVGTFGDFGCLSFFADKTITTGEGGAVLTNDPGLAEAHLYFRNQGRLERGSFIHPRLGYNFRLTDVQAGIGLAQLDKLAEIVEMKRKNEHFYRELLAEVNQVTFPTVDRDSERVPFRVNILVADPEKLGGFLEARKIGVRRFFYPIHRQPCFNGHNSRVSGVIQNSVRAFEHGLSLPSSARLRTEEIRYVCAAICDFFAGTHVPSR